MAHDILDEEFRKAGFTGAARRFPRSDFGFLMICAFNGAKPESAPRAWRYYPNESVRDCWEKVEAAAREYLKVEAS